MRPGRIAVGHPVDVASGVAYSTCEDVHIPGKVPLVWERRYSTALLEKPASPLGPGWTTRYFATLTRRDAHYQLLTPEGETELFHDPDDVLSAGGVLRNLGTYQELSKRGAHLVVTRWDNDTNQIERLVFSAGGRDETCPLVSIEDETSQGLDLTRDETGRLMQIRQRLEKRCLCLEYTADRITAISLTDRSGSAERLTRYEYDDRGLLIAAYDAAEQADRYEYNRDMRLVREMAKDGGVFSFEYDDQGRCARTSGLDGFDAKSFRYLDRTGWTEVTNSQGRVWRYQWLPTGQVVTEVDPLGNHTETEYDEHGRVLSRKNAAGSQVRYQYDDAGNRCVEIDPLGKSHQRSFNDAHLEVKYVDPAGNRWERGYDERNRLVFVVDPFGARESIFHDAVGRVIAYRDPAGNETTWNYFAEGDVWERCSPMHRIERYRQDNCGRIVEAVDGSGQATHFSYSSVCDLVRLDLPNGASFRFEYDAGRNLVRCLDGTRRTTSFQYGPCGRLRSCIHPDGSAIHYQWSSEPNQLAEVRNEAGEQCRFEYDIAGRLVRERGFDGRELHFEYDKAGRCIAMMNGAGEQTSYVRDAAGQLVGKVLPDGDRVTYELDAFGRVTSAKNAACEVRLDRDALGRPVRETLSLSEFGETYEVRRTFDGNGNVTATATSLGYESRCEYDGDNRLSRFVANGVHSIEFHRDSSGRETQRRLPGGGVLQQQYDAVGQLISQTLDHALPRFDFAGGVAPIPGTARLNRAFDYDEAGNVLSISDRLRGTVRYSYDERDRLVAAVRSDGLDEFFAYDLKGNVRSTRRRNEEAAVAEFGPGNRLTSRGETQYFHDADGRLAAKEVRSGNGEIHKWQFSWRGDELAAVTTPDGGCWRYIYDPFGRRVAKIGPAGSSRFLWDGNVVVHHVEHANGVSTWMFDPDSFSPIATSQHGEFFPVVVDHLGTPREILDSKGNVVWATSHDSWGAARSLVAVGVDCPIRFPGQWHDPETGLHYNRFRYYDPETAAYISPDPVGLQGGMNQYLYAPNPLSWVDYFGFTFGTGRPPHEATVEVWRPNADNTAYDLVSREPYRSGNMTPQEAGLPFPQNTLATHTENRAARNTPLQAGDVMVIHGQYAPCPSCRGAMNTAATTSGARVIYTWTDETGHHRWEAGQRRRRRDRCGGG